MSRDSVLTARDAIRDSPPDILLTNYKMLRLSAFATTITC
jgi:ATP-dependent helicase YprA (DUF1998 family)